MNTQPIIFFMNRKAFGDRTAIYARPTPEGKKFLMWRNIMYGLMGALILLGLVVPPLFWGITDISIILMNVVAFGVMGVIPFAISTYLGHASIHRTSYYLSPVTDPTVALTDDHLGTVGDGQLGDSWGRSCFVNFFR
ncbi:MAG: hypothetical protein R3Y06_10795 [Faecalibacterium sp.]